MAKRFQINWHFSWNPDYSAINLCVGCKLDLTVKLFLVIITVFILFAPCVTNDKGPSKNPVDIIDNNLISEIELLIADTTILDIPSTQLTRLIEVGEGQSGEPRA